MDGSHEKREREKRVRAIKKEQLAFPTFNIPAIGFSVAGQSVVRTDALAKVSGKLRFCADHSYEGFLQGKVLRSPYPHALAKSINAEKAKSLPGAQSVLTFKDVPGRNGFGAIIPDQPVPVSTKCALWETEWPGRSFERGDRGTGTGADRNGIQASVVAFRCA
jgi:CO/xanthine dehydrogenase Mo-binding subunit